MSVFADRVVVITGASGNLGAALAALCRREGARLALLARRLESLTSAFPDWDDALMLEADLTQEESVQKAADELMEAFGRVDVLANVAGGFQMGPPVHETALGTWELMMNLNAKSVFLMSRAVIPHMISRGTGQIVSVAARPALSANARMGPYAASKSAVVRLTEAMAAELKHQGVRVNCVLPSIIDTPRNRAENPNADFSRWVTPEAIARVIRFLCSPDAEPIQGAAIPVYGRS